MQRDVSLSKERKNDDDGREKGHIKSSQGRNQVIGKGTKKIGKRPTRSEEVPWSEHFAMQKKGTKIGKKEHRHLKIGKREFSSKEITREYGGGQNCQKVTFGRS